VARNNNASQRTDLLPWVFVRDAPWAPVIGACAIVVVPPADHPVFALRAATDTEPWGTEPSGTELCPPTQLPERAHDARAAVRVNDRARVRQWLQAFKFFAHAF
jgi:hypothetical protein